MLRWIFWSDFLTTLVIVLLTYWLVIILLFYKREIRNYFKTGRFKKSHEQKGDE
jgi:hypothetical protein